MLTLEEVCEMILVNELKMGFWKVFGRVSREETHFLGFLGIGCSLGEQMLRNGVRVLKNTCCFACFDLSGCFQASLRVPYVLFWLCFDELSLCNHVCFILIKFCWIELKWIWRYIWTWIWNGIKVRFFSNEMLLLWFNYYEYECRRSM